MGVQNRQNKNAFRRKTKSLSGRINILDHNPVTSDELLSKNRRAVDFGNTQLGLKEQGFGVTEGVKFFNTKNRPSHEIVS